MVNSKPRIFLSLANQITINDSLLINSESAHHLVNVLRIKKNQEIEIVDTNHNQLLVSEAISINKDKRDTSLEVCISSVTKLSAASHETTLIFAVCKNDKNEIIAQKAVELGAKTIIFYQAKNSVVELNDKKLDRIKKIATAASIQSKQNGLCEIKYIQDSKDLKSLIETNSANRIIASLQPEAKNLFEQEYKESKYLIAVGPEGDFNDEEYKLFKELAFLPIGLSRQVLRSETAAISVLSALSLKYFKN